MQPSINNIVYIVAHHCAYFPHIVVVAEYLAISTLPPSVFSLRYFAKQSRLLLKGEEERTFFTLASTFFNFLFIFYFYLYRYSSDLSGADAAKLPYIIYFIGSRICINAFCLILVDSSDMYKSDDFCNQLVFLESCCFYRHLPSASKVNV